jgi:hypothetical protein
MTHLTVSQIDGGNIDTPIPARKFCLQVGVISHDGGLSGEDAISLVEMVESRWAMRKRAFRSACNLIWRTVL